MHTFFLAILLSLPRGAGARETRARCDAGLPTFEDFGSVPYIDALMKELLRWQPVVPLQVGKS